MNILSLSGYRFSLLKISTEHFSIGKEGELHQGHGFVSDALLDDLRLCLPTVIGLCTRECPGIYVGKNLHSSEVAEMLGTIAVGCPLPQQLKTDNGAKFAIKMLDKWGYESHIRIGISPPETSTDDGKVELFNGRLQQECLNENGFMSQEGAHCKIEAWVIHYNQSPPFCAGQDGSDRIRQKICRLPE